MKPAQYGALTSGACCAASRLLCMERARAHAAAITPSPPHQVGDVRHRETVEDAEQIRAASAVLLRDNAELRREIADLKEVLATPSPVPGRDLSGRIACVMGPSRVTVLMLLVQSIGAIGHVNRRSSLS